MDGEETPGVVFGVCVALLCFFRFVCFSIYRRVKTEGFEHKLKVGSLLFFPLFVTVDKSLNSLLCASVFSSAN